MPNFAEIGFPKRTPMQLWKEQSLQAPPSYQQVSRTLIKIEPVSLDNQRLFDQGHESLEAAALAIKAPIDSQNTESRRISVASLEDLCGGKGEPSKRLLRLLNRWTEPAKNISRKITEESSAMRVGASGFAPRLESKASSPDPLLNASSADAVSSAAGKEKNAIAVKQDDDKSSEVSISGESDQESEYDHDSVAAGADDSQESRRAAPAAEPMLIAKPSILKDPRLAVITSMADSKKRKSIAGTPNVTDKRSKQDEISKFAEFVLKTSEERERDHHDALLDGSYNFTPAAVKRASNIGKKILPSRYPQVLEQIRQVCRRDEQVLESVQAAEEEEDVPVEYVTFIGVLIETLEARLGKTLFLKRRKHSTENNDGEGEAAEHQGEDVESFERKSPFECSIDAERDNQELQEEEYSRLVLDCLADITTGVDTCIMSLLLVLGEGKYLENRPGHVRQICKEETIVRCVQFLKSQVSLTINAYLEHHRIGEERDEENLEKRVLSSGAVIKALSSLVGSVCNALHYCCQVTNLTSGVGEELSFSLSYLCLDICGGSVAGNPLGMKELQLIGTNLLCAIFARYPEQRRFIVEEIISVFAISGVSKTTTYKLSDGKSIQRCSAILFQLVSACCSGPPTTNIVSLFPETLLESVDSSLMDVLSEPTKKFLNQCKSNLDASQKVVDMFFSILTSRCSAENTSKAGKKGGPSSQEAVYKTILEAILADQLILLPHLDWPVSSLVCYQSSRVFIQYLDDPNKLGEGYLRNISTDWLGKLSAILRKSNPEAVSGILKSLDSAGLGGSVQKSSSPGSLQIICRFHDLLYEYLTNLPIEESFKQSSMKVMGSLFASQFATLFQDEERKQSPEHYEMVLSFLKSFRSLEDQPSSSISKPQFIDGESAQSSYLAFQRLYPLWSLHDRIILSLTKGIDADIVPVRTKSIKSLSELLNNPFVGSDIQKNILRSITLRLADLSPVVREASVEAVSKYALGQSNLENINEYCSKIAARVMDVKVSVRKRVIKTFRDVYQSCLMKKLEPLLADITSKLLFRLRDEENSVQDLSFKTLLEIYFLSGSASLDWSDVEKDEKLNLERKMQILNGAVLLNRANIPLFYEFLEKATDKGLKFDERADHMVRTLMVYVLNLVATTEDQTPHAPPDSETIDSVLSILFEFSRLFPHLFARHISSLHSLLSFGSRNSADSITFQNAVSIIKQAIEHMEKPDVQLMTSIQDDLQQMLGKGSQSVLKASIPCLCSIVQNQTNASDKLVAISAKCYGMLQKFRNALLEGRVLPDAQLITCYRALLILCLIAGNFNFEETRMKTKAAPYSNPSLQDLTGGKEFTSVVFECAIFFTKRLLDCESSQIALTALAGLLIAKPALFVEPESVEIIRLSFESKNLNLHYELHQMFISFLEKHTKKGPEQELASEVDIPVDMKILVGNAESFHEDGIPTSLIQSFLDHILSDVLVPENLISASAFRVMSIALENGLVHPVKCVPALCAMESSADEVLSQQAFQIHQKLNDKHSSFIHTRNMDALQCVYKYQKAMSDRAKLAVRGFTRDTAFICPLYNLVRLSKSRRNTFLKNLVSIFDSVPLQHGTEFASCEEDLNYFKFVGDSLAYLDYKSQEEVLHVVFFINLILSVGGEELRATLAGLVAEEKEADALQLFRASVYSVMIQLRDFLQKRYGLSFQQCISCSPAPNQSSHAERAISVHDNSLLLWKIEGDSKAIVSSFLQLSEECLGSGDIDYSERVLATALHSSVPVTPTAPVKRGSKSAPGSSVTRGRGGDKASKNKPQVKKPRPSKPTPSKGKKKSKRRHEDEDEDDESEDEGSGGSDYC